ncbi:MAG: hypothetical protein Q8L21_01090 [Candidatus Komeilibacteria bacterium]|nr:hypothetical protein [Candidatus Komeilibacteria bacterium]
MDAIFMVAVYVVLGVVVWWLVKKTGYSVADTAATSVVDIAATSVAFVVASAFTTTIATVATIVATIVGVAIVIGVIAAEEGYKEGITFCILTSVTLAYGVGLVLSLAFGGIVGLGLMAALAVAYSLLSVLTFSMVAGRRWLARWRVARSYELWIATHSVGNAE